MAELGEECFDFGGDESPAIGGEGGLGDGEGIVGEFLRQGGGGFGEIPDEGGGVVAGGGGLLLADEDGGVGDDTVEDGGVAEVDEGMEGEVFGEELAEFFAVAGAVEFVGGDEGEDAVGLEQGGGTLVEIDEEIRGAGVGGVAFGFEEGFLILDELLADVGRIGDDDVEAALLEDIAEEEVPEEVGALRLAGGLLKLLANVLEVKKGRFEGAQGFCPFPF